MIQTLLPIVPQGATHINDILTVVRENKKWTYYHSLLPLFSHDESDIQSFRMITAQFCCNGTCTQAQIIRTFGVSKNSVLRSVKKYCEKGIKSFFQPRKVRGSKIMTDGVTARAQDLFVQGHTRREVAEELGIKYDTLRKAINRGDIKEYLQNDSDKKKKPVNSEPSIVPSDKSSRSVVDAEAGSEMGIACTRPCERIMAAIGLLPGGATTKFQTCRDVSYGGVLAALPALSENGLFRHLENLPDLSGYYMKFHVILLLAYMALCRIKTAEQIQYHPPGELGKLLGLDRVPEVRCLRKKLTELSQEKSPEEWAGLLSRDWLEQAPELAGILYVDGHVRLYHGKQTKLPRRYVSRQRLCLRGTTDYWVNDALGQPFFSVERTVDHGLLEALHNDIVPRLLQDVPNQPTDTQLEADPYLSRFVIIFDREAYSPVFFSEMWGKHRIACITYNKFPKETWPESSFKRMNVVMPNGEEVSMDLAERGSLIGSKKAERLWVREIRKLTKTGHQTSLISTDYGQLAIADAARLFSRWSQENFFSYMMQHFAIDALSEYKTESIPGTKRPVVNPKRRKLDGQCRSANAKLTKRLARYAALTLHPESDDRDIKKWEKQKSDLREEIEHLENDLTDLKERKKKTPKHLEWENMPEEEKFERLAPSRKRLIDTVKLVAYRAETALAMIAREEMSHPDEARSIVCDLFRSEADIIPNESENVLTVRIHSMANPRSNRAIQHLLDHLNSAEFVYPGTNFRLNYTLAITAQTGAMVPS